MTDRRDPAPNSELLPDDVASRLLGRASELDAARGAGWTVAELRAAAAEAGISGPAFDQAIAEVREAGRGRTSPARPGRRRRARIGAIAAGAVVLVASGVFAVLPGGGPTGAPQVPPGATVDAAADVGAAAQVLVRSDAGAPSVTMDVRRDGPLFASLGVAPGADGRRVGHVELAGAGGTATTPAALEVSGEPGAVTFSAPVGGRALELTVPGTSLRARGRAIRLVRERAGGPLRAEVVPPPAR